MNYRKFYQNAIGQKIPKGFDVHHIDGNRENNDIKNLVAIPKKVHNGFHYYSKFLDMQFSADFKRGHMHNHFLLENVTIAVNYHTEICKWIQYRNSLLLKKV